MKSPSAGAASRIGRTPQPVRCSAGTPAVARGCLAGHLAGGLIHRGPRRVPSSFTWAIATSDDRRSCLLVWSIGSLFRCCPSLPCSLGRRRRRTRRCSHSGTRSLCCGGTIRGLASPGRIARPGRACPDTRRPRSSSLTCCWTSSRSGSRPSRPTTGPNFSQRSTGTCRDRGIRHIYI